ncbi:MAG TPA: cellulose synthase operon protein YhjQ/BcsQ [Bryobacteraceae bacterium]|jgi:cellulose biosynthesis protein BcsQ
MALNRNTIDDDVDSLCTHLGLDPAAYHHFSNDAAPLGTASPIHDADQPVAGKAALPVEAPAPSAALTSNETAISNNAPTPPATRWPSLRGLGGSLVKSSEITTNPVAFHPVGGGVGLTTVLATTAKALGMMGKRVLVADDSPRSTLPFFFGARDLLKGNNSLIVSNGIPTYLLLRDSTLDTDSTDEWLWSNVAQLDTSIDALLMEVGPQMAPRTQTWLYSTGVSIFVLEPDMRSAMALPQILDVLAARKARFAEPIATYFLLNKYDEQSPFHVDMRRWLRDELDGMLAPVVLRRDHRVSEALAEGKTVLDYAPDSEIAGDFRALAQWLKFAWQR